MFLLLLKQQQAAEWPRSKGLSLDALRIVQDDNKALCIVHGSVQGGLMHNTFPLVCLRVLSTLFIGMPFVGKANTL